MSDWTQSACDDCWDLNYAGKDRRGFSERKGMGDKETCSYCGVEHRSGIYVRDDPRLVSFPRKSE